MKKSKILIIKETFLPFPERPSGIVQVKDKVRHKKLLRILLF